MIISKSAIRNSKLPKCLVNSGLLRFSKKHGKNSSWFILVTLDQVGNGGMVIDAISRIEDFPMLTNSDFHFAFQHEDKLLTFMNRTGHLFYGGGEGHQEWFHIAVSHAR